jgi:hypothetical protein
LILPDLLIISLSVLITLINYLLRNNSLLYIKSFRSHKLLKVLWDLDDLFSAWCLFHFLLISYHYFIRKQFFLKKLWLHIIFLIQFLILNKPKNNKI